MALIHWWQLDGDLKDYGSNATPLADARYNGGDQTANFTLNHLGRKAVITSDLEDGFYCDNFSQSGSYTISIWMCPSSSSNSYGNVIGSGSRDNTGTITGFSIYEMNSKLYFFGTAVNINNVSTSTNKFNHIVIRKKETMNFGLYELFVNNEKKATYDTQNYLNIIDDKLYFGWLPGNSSNNSFSGIISDIRIYDEAISNQDIDELYKYCIYHFTFNDLLYQTNSDMLSLGISLKNDSGTISSNIFTSKSNVQIAQIYLVCKSKLEKTKYFLSFYIDNPNNTTFNSGEISILGSTSSTTFTPKNGLNVITYTPPSATLINAMVLIKLIQTPTASNVYSIFYAYNFQLEKTGISNYQKLPTPFTGYYKTGINTEHIGELTNDTGYKMPTQNVGSRFYGEENIDTDAFGPYSVNLYNSDDCYFELIDDNLGKYLHSFSMWVKFPSTLSASSSMDFLKVLDTNNSSNRFLLYLNINNIGSSIHNGQFDGSPNDSGPIYYVDGIKVAEGTTTIKTDLTFIGGWHYIVFTNYDFSKANKLIFWPNLKKDGILLSDLKIYANNLTEEQIKAEYRSHTQFANDNSIFANYFEEINSSEETITSNLNASGTVKAYNFTEGADKISLFDDKTISAFSFKEGV